MSFQEASLCTVLEKNLIRNGNRIAYQFLENHDCIGETLTYEDLAVRAAAGARTLAELGLAGQRVALMAPSTAEFVVSFFAILWSGGVVVPMAPVRTNADKNETALKKLDHLLSVAQIAAIVADAAIIARLSGYRQLCPALGKTAIVDIADLCTPNRPIDRRQPQDTAVIQFTSGSTSEPKGVCVTHSNFIGNSATMAGVFAATPDDSMLHWLPLYHDMGLIGGIVAPLCNVLPSTIIPAARFAAEPGYWLKAISHVGATMSTAPNFAYQLCAEKMITEEIEALDLRRWRAAICGSEPIRAAALELFAERFATAGFSSSALFPTYGLAEATIYVTGGPVGRGMSTGRFDRQALEKNGRAQPAKSGNSDRVLVSCGSFPREHDIVIVDTQAESACNEGEVGEIWLRGPGVASGYLSPDDTSPQVFDRAINPWGSGFLATGDLGFLLNGELYVVGRLRDLIILDGVNHYPQDIELAARGDDENLSGCINAAFQSEEHGGGVVLIQEVPRRSIAEIQTQLSLIRRHVAEREQIALATLVAVARGSIPRTSSGKVARRQTRALWQAGALKILSNGDGYAAPASVARSNSVVKQKVVELWRAALGHNGFSSETPFFEAGGTSLQLTGLHGAMLRAFAVDFPIVELMDHSTVQAMTQLIDMKLDPDIGSRDRPAAQKGRSTHLTVGERLTRRMVARSSVVKPSGGDVLS